MTDLAGMLAAVPQSDEYLAYANAHWHELIDRYEPCAVERHRLPRRADLEGLFERYYAAVPDGVVNNRFDWMGQSAGAVHCDFVTPEYSTAGRPPEVGESTRGIGTSFGFNRFEPDDSYLDPDELVRMFVDVVAHGGNLLLNVGPTAEGVIPWVQAQRLLALGWWLRTNGGDLRHPPVDAGRGRDRRRAPGPVDVGRRRLRGRAAHPCRRRHRAARRLAVARRDHRAARPRPALQWEPTGTGIRATLRAPPLLARPHPPHRPPRRTGVSGGAGAFLGLGAGRARWRPVVPGSTLGMPSAGREAELGPDLGQAGLGLGVGRGLLDLEHAALDRGAL